MRSWLCKVFRFLLDLVGQVVDLVASTLIKIGTAVVEVLSEVAGAAFKALLGNPFLLIGLGVAAYWWLSSDDDEEVVAEKTDAGDGQNVVTVEANTGG